MGGFGDKGLEGPQIPAVPKRTPCHTASYHTADNLALLYRLTGDINPLHIDPNMAQLGGFEKPILHGLCTYGISARLIYEKFCNKDPNQIKSYSARFTSHIFPGETLVVEAYKEGN